MNNTKYQLVLNTEQAKLLSGACEFYARMMMGQWKDLLWHTMSVKDRPNDYCEAMEIAETHLLEARAQAFPDLSKTFAHSFGVGKFTDADQVWEIHEVLRNRIAWTEHPEGGNTVDFGSPISFSGKPLAECNVIKDPMPEKTAGEMFREMEGQK